MPALTVAENVFLGSQPTTRSGLVDWKRMRARRRRASRALRHRHRRHRARCGRFRSAGSSSSRSPGSSSPAHRSSCSTSRPPRCRGRRRSGSSPRCDELKARGTSLVFISHFLEDVLAVSDRVTVLKNSRKVATLPNEGSDQAPPDPADDRPRRRRRWPRATRAASRCRRRRRRRRCSRSRTQSGGELRRRLVRRARRRDLGIFGNLGAGMTEVARVALRPRAPDVRDDAARREADRAEDDRARRSGSASPTCPRTGGRPSFPATRSSRTSPWPISTRSSAASFVNRARWPSRATW